MNTHNSSERPGISGKRATLVVLGLLLFSGALLSYVLWSYQQLDTIRAESEQAWMQLRDDLARRYHDIELALEAEAFQADASAPDPEAFAEAVDRFLTTSQTMAQAALARDIEAQLANTDLDAIHPGPELQRAEEAFNDSLAREAHILASPGGQVLSLFLSFPQPIPLELAGEAARPPERDD